MRLGETFWLRDCVSEELKDWLAETLWLGLIDCEGDKDADDDSVGVADRLGVSDFVKACDAV